MARSRNNPAAGTKERTGWQDRLRRESCKLTGPRRAILHVLGGQSRPLSSRKIFDRLPVGEGDLTTVYRALGLLERLRMVKRFHFGDGVARFALLEERHQGHQHHLVCTRCASMVEVGDCIVRDLEKRIAARSRFKAVTHRLEFFGVCPACQ